MVFLSKTATSTTANNNGGSSGMGFLFVLFPTVNNNKKKHKFINITNSSSLILTKTQSAISICALLVFLTLLLFTLSTFEPNQTLHHHPKSKPHLTTTTKQNLNHWFFKVRLSEDPNRKAPQRTKLYSPIALQGMGTLFRRGNRAMSDLAVCHVAEDVNEQELRLFLRVLYRSGLTARTDFVFIFGSPLMLSRLGSVIETENESFMKLVDYYKELQIHTNKSVLSFDLDRFMRSGKREIAETLWGKRIKLNGNSTDSNKTTSSRLTYGSVVGFDANELDPVDSLAGFLNHVPMSLRRWACFPMLLGRVRRNFKHVMLVDVKNSVLLGDPLVRVRNRSPESVYVSIKQEETKHHRRNSDKTQLNTAILMGGSRGIRKLSNAMLYEIIRAATVHKKKKNSVTESGILSQLVSNEHLLKNIDLIKSAESVSVPGTSLLTELAAMVDHSIIQLGNSNYDVNSIIMKLICSCEIDSSVYTDC